MATFLDLSLLGVFGSIFIFILVWVVVYGLLQYVKAFGGADKKGLHGIVALMAAGLVLLSRNVLSFITFVVPWYLVLGMVVFLFIFVFKIFGISDATIADAGKDVRMWIIVLGIVILIFGFGAAFGQQTLEQTPGTDVVPPSDISPTVNTTTPSTNTGSFTQNVYDTIFHPKVLGILFLFIVGILMLVFLTSN